MKERLQNRLQELKNELQAGQEMLAQTEEKRNDLRQTLLRISGAVQVLEEILSQEPEGKTGGAEDENVENVK